MTNHAHYLVEDDSLRLAIQLVEQYEPFHQFPKDSPKEGQLIGWVRRIGKQGISRGEGRTLLRSDLTGHLAALRAKIFMQDAERLGAPRIAVLLHLAMLMGAQHIVDWRELWDDLGRGDFNAAANHLLLSEWPSLIGDSLQERMRAVALQDILRHGEMPRKPA